MDPASILTILGVANEGTKTLGGAIDVIKRLRGSGSSATDVAEIKELAGSLAEQLYAARMTNLEVVTQLQDLLRSAERENRVKETLAKYRPFTLPIGGVVLQLVDDADREGFYFRICPTCAERDGLISPLQGGDRHLMLTCSTCKARFPNITSN